MMAVEMDPVMEVTEEAKLFHDGLEILLKEMRGKVSHDIMIDSLISAGLDQLHHSALHDCADDRKLAGEIVKEHMILVLDRLLEDVWVNDAERDSS
jgi:hypothetical protein